MPFGKHKGQLLSEIPADYLEWLLSLDHIRNPLRGVVEQELELRAEEAARAIDACPDVQIADGADRRGRPRVGQEISS